MSLELSSPALNASGTPAAGTPAADAQVKPCCQKSAQAASAAPSAPATATPMAAPVRAAPTAPAPLMGFLRVYQPIVAITGAALAGSLMLSLAGQGFSTMHMMQSFMGLFLLPLALLKLFDIGGFASAFARYDAVAKAWPPYAYAYPFIELALALFFLSGLAPVATNITALVIGAVGTVGIVRSLASGQQVRCACVGSTLDVPLGTVSVLENTGMAAMAGVMLIM